MPRQFGRPVLGRSPKDRHGPVLRVNEVKLVWRELAKRRRIFPAVLHLDYDISLGPKLKRTGFQSDPGQASERALRRDESGFLRDEVQGGACFLSPRGGRRGEAWARLQRREVRREFLRPSGRKLVICGRL
jgi:hypothetical protein